ncbi:hypothetical protein DSS3PM1_00034 [Bacteriophage DSS3_PM1]|nr:hypothetical protein DSS3PM1_00034 [Bacteriophage DSS3_PM1]
MENSNFNLMYQADFYKVSHIAQYPDNVSHIHSTLVARKAVNDIGRKTRMNKDGLGQFGRFKDHVILVCDDDDAVQTLDDETTASLEKFVE